MNKSHAAMVCTMLLSFSLARQAAADARCGATDQTPALRYTVSGNEVFDQNTKVTWMRCSLDQRWIGGEGCVGPVKAYKAEEISGSIPENWRLPTLEEIVTLAAICPASAANKEVFSSVNLWIGFGVWISDKAIGEGRPVAYSSLGGKNHIYLTMKNGAPMILVKK